MESQTYNLYRSYLFQLGILLIICSFGYTANVAASDDNSEIDKRPGGYVPNWMRNYMSGTHKRAYYVPNWVMQRLREQHKLTKRPMYMPTWLSRYIMEQHRIHKKLLYTPSWQYAYLQAARRRQQRAKRPGSYNPFNWLHRYTIQSKRDSLISDPEEIEVRKRPVWLPFYWRQRYRDQTK